MASRSRDVPYGRASAESAGPSVRIDAGVPLRLCHGPYPFAEPPDLVRLTTVAERMGVLCEHLQSLCRPWDKRAPLFLTAYFAAIDAAIAGARPALEALAARAGGLFAPEDWSFMALRPLPQAHLGADVPACAELAFWTGARFIAILIEGSTSLTRAEREAVAQIERAGAEIVRVPARVLGGGALFSVLPPEFIRFWEGVPLPASPFGPDALAEF